MTDQNKTHYRKVFKSDHLGQADLEGLLLKIGQVS